MKKLGIAIVSLLLLVSTLLISAPAYAESGEDEVSFKLCSDGEADLLRLYFALFNREADQDGGDYWINEHRQGASLSQLAFWMSKGPEFYIKYKGIETNADLVDKFYQNIFKRTPDDEGKTYWVGQLDEGLEPHLAVRWMAQSPELAARHPYEVADSCPELEESEEETEDKTYANCTEVWEDLGRAIKYSDAGYSHDLDTDKDGTGCETDPR